MTHSLGPLYHWSPREVRKSIERYGLLPGKPGVHSQQSKALLGTTDEGEFAEALALWRAPHVCLATSPVGAWNYSHGGWRTAGTFDLWSVSLEDKDEVQIQPSWGARIVEVRVRNRIFKRQLVWVGERHSEIQRSE